MSRAQNREILPKCGEIWKRVNTHLDIRRRVVKSIPIEGKEPSEAMVFFNTIKPDFGNIVYSTPFWRWQKEMEKIVQPKAP